MGIEDSICSWDHLLNQTSCEYISDNCNSKFFFVAKSYYCSNNDPGLGRALIYSIGLLLIIGILILILSLIVSNYLLYCVTNFADLFGINKKVLSFFIIPLTNSLPDLFNYHVAMKSDSVDLVLGQVIGANLITFTIVIGLICFLCPFSAKDNMAIIYGLIWVLVMISVLAYVMSDSRVNFLECSLMCILFIIYTWTLHYFNIQEVTGNLGSEADIPNKVNANDEHTYLIPQPLANEVDYIEATSNYSLWERFIDAFDCLIFVFIPVSRRTLMRLKKSERAFLHTLFTSRIFHLWMVLMSCILLNFNTLQLGMGYVVLVATTFYLTFEVIRKYADETCCNVLADIVSICNSLGFLSFITQELIQLLKNLGAIWKISEYTMGLLVFSIVNSINDIVMNILLSTKLSPTLGVSSCLGTSLLLILIGIGLNGILRLTKCGNFNQVLHGALNFTLSPEIYMSMTSLIVIVLIYILYLPLNQWKFDRRLGVFSICLWMGTIVTCLIMDYEMGN